MVGERRHLRAKMAILVLMASLMINTVVAWRSSLVVLTTKVLVGSPQLMVTVRDLEDLISLVRQVVMVPRVICRGWNPVKRWTPMICS